MSIRAKRGTTAQINAAAAQNGLKLSELIYDTDKGSLEVATGAGSRQALMKEAFATQAQAEAGTDNTLPMTPLRTAQAIAAKRGAANGLASLGADGKVPFSELKAVGTGQAWQAVTRTIGTSYQNETGSPIAVAVGGRSASENAIVSFEVSADNSTWLAARFSRTGVGGGGSRPPIETAISMIVPVGYYYRVTTTDPNGTILSWLELR